MKKLTFITWLLPAIFAITCYSGCSMCCGPDDFNYGTYGGLHPRADMRQGRVGSVFSDPSGTALNLVPHGEKTAADSIEPLLPEKQPEGTPDNTLPVPKKQNDGVPASPIQYRRTPKRLKTPPRQTRPQTGRMIFGGRRIH